MKLYSFSEDKTLKREGDGSILAFNEQDIEYVAECFEGYFMHELEVNEEDIIHTGSYLVDSIKSYNILNGKIVKTKLIDTEYLTEK